MSSARLRNLVALGVVALLSQDCSRGKDILVQLETHKPPVDDPRQLEVQAMVLGPQTGLRYKWFSVNGDFDPQDSYVPKTQFTFAVNAPRDRIWVEVWRDAQKIAESQLDITTDTRPQTAGAKAPDASITIDRVPKYQPAGGPDTRDTIAGTVHIKDPADYRVVVYARADAWYIQPTPFALQTIQNDNTWQTWTHTGSNYAVLVVRKSYKPMTRLDVLPPVDADVLSRAIVEGKKP
jgi:hypothetical protein